MASTEQLIFEILAKDNASAALLRTSKSAEDAAGNVKSLDDRLIELSKRSVDARVGLKGDKEAEASIDKIQAKLITLGSRNVDPEVNLKGALTASAEIAGLEKELDSLGHKSDDTTKSVDKLAGNTGGGALSSLSGLATSGGGMAALIGAGVALSPIIATLGTGLAGLGVAAYGIAKPITTAAQATGGLQANLHTLHGESLTVAQGILGLGTRYHQFQNALQPTVLAVFNQGLKLASSLMHDIEPVAAATGKAFDQWLGALGKDFQSGEWQHFFAWMAANAGPDMQQLGTAIISVLNSLPQLTTALQPVASALLTVTTDTGHLLSALGELGQATEHPKSNSIIGEIGSALGKASTSLNNALPDVVKNALNLSGASVDAGKSLAQVAQSASNAGTASKTAAGNFGTAATSVSDLSGYVEIAGTKFGNAQAPTLALSKSMYSLGQGSQTAVKSAVQIGIAAPNFVKLSRATDEVGKSFGNAALVKSMHDFTGNTALAAKETKILNENSAPLKTTITDLQTKYSNLATAELAALGPLETFANNSITSANDLANLNTALKTSHDRVGLLTQNQRNSFSTAQTYISQLQQQAQKALSSGQGAKSAATNIANGLPTLAKAARSNATLRKEVDLLRQAYENLRKEQAIHTAITVTGSGSWSYSQGQSGKRVGPGGLRYAAGGRIPGYGGGDTVPALLEPGETVVPKQLTPAFATAFRAAGIPGFATGGIVPSYRGTPGGMAPWTTNNWDATVAGITASIGHAMASSFASSLGGMLHPTGSGGTVERLMQSMAASVGWTGQQWDALYSVEQREAGFNLQARNPTSGAYGLAQFINGAGEYAQYGGNWYTAAGQITAMLNYIKQRYGSPEAAWSHEVNFGWYKNGLHTVVDRPTLIGVGEAGREQVDVTPLHGRVASRSGPLVNVQGNVVVREQADVGRIARELDFRVKTSWMG